MVPLAARYRSSRGTSGTGYPQGNPMKKVTRMRPRRHDVISESIRTILDMPLDQPQAVRDFLSDALGRFAPPDERWSYVMMNPEQQRLVLKAIKSSDRPLQTMGIWLAAISHVRYDTGEIMAGRVRLAEDAGLSPEHASRALSALTEIGALVRVSRGRYAINPYVGWSGSLVKREAATKGATPLRVVSAD
jgi:hypothetical protein